ncbi:NUDIX hydrolase [Bifidobacterium crudilactis]|jgi:ADP-ribose pyrophosphatase|uniref:NUDIX hydrolase n=1 Tax=Bifidobacterium crudilactis TaxID=327277 RepID=UPI0009FD6D8C|nr:NUDIX hydrolase [Bifidobacterium crudilactis]MCI2148718.1 NUDIX hydrolase [Bifidobacterium crudilactis]MCI2156974.1 NUDIX hydrolase [Bifidobacterium crudilactis]
MKEESKMADAHDECGVYNEEPPFDLDMPEVVYDSGDSVSLTVTRIRARLRRNNAPYTLRYVSVKHRQPGAVCVVCHDGLLLLARHWRVATGEFGWEFPRGMGESGETPTQTANRELHEETGLEARNTRLLQLIHADTGLLADQIAVTEITPKSTEPTSAASAELDWELNASHWFSTDDIERMIAKSIISDGITLASYCIWKAHHSAEDAN